jgi:CubicO group peptidase (beta-lactamase class C family)
VRSKEGLYVPAKYFPYHRAHAPSSTLYSNVADMLRWLRANLNEGELEGRRMLGAKTLREMLSDGVERPLPPSTPIRSIQHLGWSTLVLDGISVHGHGGHDIGFRSMMVFAPQARAAVVIMTNGDADNVKVDQLGLQLLGMAVGKDWSGF